MKQRIIVWFSCGEASAVAAKLTLQKYGNSHDVMIVNCDTRNSEHPDNYRFSADVEKWLGVKIFFIKNDAYVDVDDIIKKERYMSGTKGAKCTTVLKKIPRFKFAQPDDLHVFGFTKDEQRRIDDFEINNPDMRLLWVLRDEGVTKAGCRQILRTAGIKQAAMYELGFDNNNCPGCLKASSPWYWDMVRKHFPQVFQKRCEQSRHLGLS